MCDPLTIAGIALSGASAVANGAAASKAASARKSALAAENRRQAQLQQEANALNVQSQDRYTGFQDKQEDRGTELGDYFTSQADAPAPVAGANEASFMPVSSSNITIAEEGKQRGAARAFTDKSGEALGNLRSFGDLLGGISRDQARDAGSIGQVGGFMRGSSSILPYETEAAAQKGQGLKLFGDVLGGAGSIATNAGLSGKTLGGLFGR